MSVEEFVVPACLRADSDLRFELRQENGAPAPVSAAGHHLSLGAKYELRAQSESGVRVERLELERPDWATSKLDADRLGFRAKDPSLGKLNLLFRRGVRELRVRAHLHEQEDCIVRTLPVVLVGRWKLALFGLPFGAVVAWLRAEASLAERVGLGALLVGGLLAIFWLAERLLIARHAGRLFEQLDDLLGDHAAHLEAGGEVLGASEE